MRWRVEPDNLDTVWFLEAPDKETALGETLPAITDYYCGERLCHDPNPVVTWDGNHAIVASREYAGWVKVEAVN